MKSDQVRSVSKDPEVSGMDVRPIPLPALNRYRYNSPLVQVGILGVICFSLPGMFNALNGLGGGGKSDPTITDNANTALAVTFAVCSLLAGGIFNVVGPQLMLFVGGLTYALYISSYIFYETPFVITAGGVLGVGAGFLWATQGAIMLSYPDEAHKGKYFGLFWTIYNCGATMGSLVALIIEWNSGESSASKTTYFVFIVIMVAGSLLSLVLLSPKKVLRDNHEPVSIHKYSSCQKEVVEILKLFKDWRMLALSPLFLASNWYYTYEFNDFNGGGYFTIRTRALNGFVFFVSQMLGSNLMGNVMDSKKWVSKSRRIRALAGLTVIGLLTTCIWGGALAFQLTFTRHTLAGLVEDSQKVDLSDIARYVGPLILYALFGLLDAILATYIYWIMGALTNDTPTAARFAGFFKCVQNVGAAMAGQVDARKASYLLELLLNWGLLTVGVLSASFVAYSVTETSVEDIKVSKYSDSEGSCYTSDLECPSPKKPPATKVGAHESPL